MIINPTFPMVAKTMSGLEECLAKELKELGAGDVELLHRAVSFTGDTELMYMANYYCRTALRILKPILTFSVTDENDLYNKVKEVDWWQYFGVNDTFAVDAVLSTERFRHSQFISLRTKDAIVDKFRDHFNRRPDVDLEEPDMRINIHIQDDMVTLALDSSGSSLHRRGYRQRTHEAPMNEVLAAGLVMLSEWDRQSPLVDPMCGSGTILIEAAMMAKNIPAGYYRKGLGLCRWKDFDRKLWEHVKSKIPIKSDRLDFMILGGDKFPAALAMARTNLRIADLQRDIRLSIKDFSELEPPRGPGTLITNPPYGERMAVEDIVALYKALGDTFKKRYSAYNAWVISSDIDSLKQLGLTPSRKIKVFNGPLECRFMQYKMYEGTKKVQKTE